MGIRVYQAYQLQPLEPSVGGERETMCEMWNWCSYSKERKGWKMGPWKMGLVFQGGHFPWLL